MDRLGWARHFSLLWLGIILAVPGGASGCGEASVTRTDGHTRSAVPHIARAFRVGQYCVSGQGGAVPARWARLRAAPPGAAVTVQRSAATRMRATCLGPAMEGVRSWMMMA